MCNDFDGDEMNIFLPRNMQSPNKEEKDDFNPNKVEEDNFNPNKTPKARASALKTTRRLPKKFDEIMVHEEYVKYFEEKNTGHHVINPIRPLSARLLSGDKQNPGFK